LGMKQTLLILMAGLVGAGCGTPTKLKIEFTPKSQIRESKQAINLQSVREKKDVSGFVFYKKIKMSEHRSHSYSPRIHRSNLSTASSSLIKRSRQPKIVNESTQSYHEGYFEQKGLQTNTGSPTWGPWRGNYERLAKTNRDLITFHRGKHEGRGFLASHDIPRIVSKSTFLHLPFFSRKEITSGDMWTIRIPDYRPKSEGGDFDLTDYERFQAEMECQYIGDTDYAGRECAVLRFSLKTPLKDTLSYPHTLAMSGEILCDKKTGAILKCSASEVVRSGRVENRTYKQSIVRVEKLETFENKKKALEKNQKSIDEFNSSN
jgi:hypothetical protein